MWNEHNPFAQPTSGFGPYGQRAPYVTRFGRAPVPMRSPYLGPGVTIPRHHVMRPATVQFAATAIEDPTAHMLVPYGTPQPFAPPMRANRTVRLAARPLHGLGDASTGDSSAPTDAGALSTGILASAIGAAVTGAVVGAVATHGMKGAGAGALAGAGVAGVISGFGALFVGQPMIGIVSALGGAVGLLAGWTVSGHQHRHS
jgi:hypothetical protein